MPCDASATPGGLRCWCRVETKWRWKELKSIKWVQGLRKYFGVLVVVRKKMRAGQGRTHATYPHLTRAWKERVNTNSKNERTHHGRGASIPLSACLEFNPRLLSSVHT